MEYIEFILKNYGIVMLIMIALIEIVMYVIKKPLKKLTSKIKNDKIRLLANKAFILLVFILAAIFYYFGHLWVSKYVDFNLLKIALTGAFSIVFYSLGDGVFKKVDVNNIKDIDEATKQLVQTTQSAIDSITKDETDIKDVVSAVDAFNNLCSKLDDESKK